MKITKIELKDFHQFKDLTIDLTYPAGHAKAGEPLEKICFIGQSGTGKTTLLKLLAGIVSTKQNVLDDLVAEYGAEELKSVNVTISLDGLTYISHIHRDTNAETAQHGWDEYAHIDMPDITFESAVKLYQASRESRNLWIVFFPATLNYELGDAVDKTDLLKVRIADFRRLSVSTIWRVVLAKVEKYQEEELKRKQGIADLVVEAVSMNTELIKEALADFEQWKNNFQSPIEQLADECLDKALFPLNLRVSRAFKFDTKEDIGDVKIEDKNGNQVPYDLLSTGTKQIMLTAIPLYYLKPEKTVILCDEPERSLYPSMQRFIIDFYGSLTKDCQMFYATHSPIIASCFEPWEIVELKFNDEGYVKQDLYYPKDAERHVDNYTIIPSYLTYDLMLKEVFDLKDTHPHERSEKITEVLMLRNQLKQLKKEGKMKTKEAKDIYAAYKDLAGKLFWEFEIQ